VTVPSYPVAMLDQVNCRHNSDMIKYKHVLALNPYFRDSAAARGIFPPTGLEYIVTSMKDLIGKVTFLDLGKLKVSGKIKGGCPVHFSMSCA